MGDSVSLCSIRNRGQCVTVCSIRNRGQCVTVCSIRNGGQSVIVCSIRNGGQCVTVVADADPVSFLSIHATAREKGTVCVLTAWLHQYVQQRTSPDNSNNETKGKGQQGFPSTRGSFGKDGTTVLCSTQDTPHSETKGWALRNSVKTSLTVEQGCVRQKTNSLITITQRGD